MMIGAAPLRIAGMGIRESRRGLANLVPRAAASAMAAMPLPVAEALGAGAATLIAVGPTRFRRRSLDNLAQALPERPSGARARLSRRALAHAGREAGATIKWFATDRERLPGLCVNYAEVVATLAADRAGGRGAIWVGAHLGNPQLLSALCATVAPVTGVGTEYHFRAHLRFVAEGRARLGMRYVATSEPPLELLRALQRNELVTFLPDVQPRRSNGVWVPFFGRPACTTTFPAALARLTGAVLRPAFLVRDGRGYRAVLRDPIAAPRLADGDAGLERAITAWSDALEQEVRARPEQWIWMSRRWRERPAEPAADAPVAARASQLAGPAA
jgi:KDO2-lipid IV(A) lauroyltransferase